jgi:beta-lactamase regulating signal transducer with metallopeptidase domain
MWTAVCLILVIVGFATLTSQPSGDIGDVAFAVNDGDVAAMALGLWLLGILLLLVAVAARRALRRVRRSGARM